jgi:REP element-mobilizing transposase RayT
MARKPRIEYAGAVYNVMSRGDHGEEIFRDERDRLRFLETLGEGCEKTGWWVHAYVLMSNHYHLLVETPEANLVAGMQWLQGTYTQRFNSRHRLRGHLFQGRYEAYVESRALEVEGDPARMVSGRREFSRAVAGPVGPSSQGQEEAIAWWAGGGRTPGAGSGGGTGSGVGDSGVG